MPDRRTTPNATRLPALAVALAAAALVLAAPPLSAAGPTFDLKEWGAAGDGVQDDGPVFQEALDELAALGGGSVYLPPGTYFVDRTLLVGSHTRIYGDGKESVVLRGNTLGTYEQGVWDGACQGSVTQPARMLFVNAGYNCGNEGIVLEDFAIDGSRVLEIDYPAVTIALSAVEDSHVRRLTIYDVPQDAIFVRNGGVGCTVSDNIVDGYNMLKANGAAVNVEMWPNGNLPGELTVARNEIVARAPAFCSDGKTPCALDGSCPGGAACNKGPETVGISARSTQGGEPARLVARDNTIYLTGQHHGIVCLGCVESWIDGNVLAPYTGSGSAFAGLYTGILASGDALAIVRNEIVGSGDPGDGRGLLLEGGSLSRVEYNTVRDKSVASGLAAVQVRGQRDFAFGLNQVTGIGGGPAVTLGYCPFGYGSTGSGHVWSNTLDAIGQPALKLDATAGLHVSGNTLGGPVSEACTSSPLVFADRLPTAGRDGRVAYDFAGPGTLSGARVGETLLPASGPFTVVVWARLDAMGSTDGGVLGQYYDDPSRRTAITVRHDGAYFQIGDDSIHAARTLSQGTWYALAFRRDAAGAMSLFVNGLLAASGPSSAPVDAQATTIGHVRQGPVNSRFDGVLDDLHVYSRALTDTEIRYLAWGWVQPGDLDPDAWSFEDWAWSL